MHSVYHHNVGPLKVVEGRPAYWATYGAIALAVLLISVFTEPSRFGDFHAYVLYLDGLVHYPSPNWMYFEVFSNLYMLGSHWLVQSVFSAVVFAHYLLSIFFVLALGAAFPPRRTPWPTLLFIFAMLGPLLAFVTMRATPAYFLVAIGVRYAIDRRPAAWLCLAAAALFHISALLAAPPMALLYFERHLPAILRSGQSRRYYLLLALAIVAVGAVLPYASSSVTSLIQAIPVISKYDAYTDSASAETQIGHYIFLAFVSLLTVAFLAAQRGAEAKLNMFVLASFALYVVMFFSASPIAAFRQAPFWAMPMIAALPWGRLGLNRATMPVFIVLCVGLFLFQFKQVYI